MIFIGIDPGLGGAVAAIGANGDWLEVHATPVFMPGKGTKRTYDVLQMRVLLDDMTRGGCEDVRCVIEKQQARPGQGVTSMYAIGLGFGIWLGLLAGLQIPHEIVRPQVWQKALGLPPKSGKAGAVAAASRLWPDAPIRGPRGGALDGHADALLLAEWGRRQNNTGGETR